MVKYKVTRAHDGKWYVYHKYPIVGTGNHRWVAQSEPCDSRAEAFGHLPAGEKAEDTITLLS